MATIRRELRIERPADDVWAVVAEVGSVHRWFPGIVGCEVLETDDGRVRRVELATGLRLDESIVTVDPIARRFQYSIGGGVFRHHLGTVDVIALDDQSCLVVYGTDATPDVMALVIGGATGQALSNLADLVGAPAGGAT